MVGWLRAPDSGTKQLTLRYYLIAAAIVLVVGSIIALHAHANHDLKIRSVDVVGSPSVGRKQAISQHRNGAFIGDAPWALSALPECLIQTLESRGPTRSVVMSHLPTGARPIEAGTTLRFHDCTIRIERDQAFVSRGADRFHIPPSTRFWRAGNQLVMLRISSGAELRIYSPSNI